MKLEIVNERKNPLLKRKEMQLSVDFERRSTPSKAEMQLAVSKQFKADIKHIEVSKVVSETGLPKGKAWIKIWDEKEGFDYVKENKEEAPKEEPKEEKKEEPKVEEKPEEKKEEAPKEEKPVEKKEEPKKEEAPVEKPKEVKEEKSE